MLGALDRKPAAWKAGSADLELARLALALCRWRALILRLRTGTAGIQSLDAPQNGRVARSCQHIQWLCCIHRPRCTCTSMSYITQWNFANRHRNDEANCAYMSEEALTLGKCQRGHQRCYAQVLYAAWP